MLDPAMGSGHFLVTAVDYLSDDIARLVEYAPVYPEWLGGEYESPLVGRIASIRDEIERRAEESSWILDRAQLTDQAIIRRMVLKRCIYGVDKNPLTVELAKVSLWLHSFTVGAPLSFLDHHLRRGDSLIGLRVTDAREDLRKLGGLLTASALAGVETAADGMQLIEEMSDADVAEVRESAALFRNVEQTTADLRGALDFLCGLRWQTAGMKRLDRMAREGIVSQNLGERPDAAYTLLARGPNAVDAETPDDTQTGFNDLWTDAAAIARRERFLHWEAAFPGVWRGWQDYRPEGGFDAVIGNPPWDRIKLQEVEWFATRGPELARAPTAAARRAGIRELRREGAPLAADFDAAKERADKLGRLVRASGHYPLLGGGDINLYSLFVERAMSLIKPDGLVGLLTPSSIYADKTAARFFKSVSTKGRVSGLFDFENRRLGTEFPPYFPDVDSRFKFCALIFGGEGRRFDETDCAFFLHDTRTIDDPDPLLSAGAGRLRPRQPQHRHRPDLPHPPRRRYHPPNLRAASRARGPLGRRRAPRLARQVRPHVRHDQRLAPLPHRRAARGRRLLSGPGQPLEAGRRRMPALVRGQDGAGVRSPRRERGGQSPEPEPSGPAAPGDARRARRSELAARPAVLGQFRLLRVALAAGLGVRFQRNHRTNKQAYGHQHPLAQGGFWKQDSGFPAGCRCSR